MKYFLAGDKEAHDYKDGRGYEALSSFVDSTLSGGCDITSEESIKETCDKKEQGYVAKMKVKSELELKAELQRINNVLKTSVKKESKEWFIKRKGILVKLTA